MRQDKGRLVLDAQITPQREHRLALDLIADNDDGEQIHPQR
jgi:hypothetical protein